MVSLLLVLPDGVGRFVSVLILRPSNLQQDVSSVSRPAATTAELRLWALQRVSIPIADCDSSPTGSNWAVSRRSSIRFECVPCWYGRPTLFGSADGPVLYFFAVGVHAGALPVVLR